MESWIALGDEALDDRQRRYLEPHGPILRLFSTLFHAAIWVAMRILFRMRVEGQEHLRRPGPFILVPNHSSSLDPLALAAAIPISVMQQTRWAAYRKSVLRNRPLAFLNRLGRSVPVNRDLSALSAAAVVLHRGENLIWFPEGTRTTTGHLQPFKPGIGALMRCLRVPVVPVCIAGTYEAMPPDRSIPRLLMPIRVTFGGPIDSYELTAYGEDDQRDYLNLATMLHDQIAAMQQRDTHDTEDARIGT